MHKTSLRTPSQSQNQTRYRIHPRPKYVWVPKAHSNLKVIQIQEEINMLAKQFVEVNFGGALKRVYNFFQLLSEGSDLRFHVNMNIQDTQNGRWIRESESMAVAVFQLVFMRPKKPTCVFVSRNDPVTGNLQHVFYDFTTENKFGPKLSVKGIACIYEVGSQNASKRLCNLQFTAFDSPFSLTCSIFNFYRVLNNAWVSVLGKPLDQDCAKLEALASDSPEHKEVESLVRSRWTPGKGTNTKDLQDDGMRLKLLFVPRVRLVVNGGLLRQFFHFVESQRERSRETSQFRLAFYGESCEELELICKKGIVLQDVKSSHLALFGKGHYLSESSELAAFLSRSRKRWQEKQEILLVLVYAGIPLRTNPLQWNRNPVRVPVQSCGAIEPESIESCMDDGEGEMLMVTSSTRLLPLALVQCITIQQ